jgi:hypothetical protein
VDLLGASSSVNGISAGVTQTTAGVTRQNNVENKNTSSLSGQSSQDNQNGQNSSSDQITLGNASALTAEEQRQVAALSQRDRQVHTHEQAHMAAGGNLVRGGPTYDYETGPDGKRYAVGGEVQIDTTAVRDNPQVTITKAEHIRQAALAPVDPSAQDRAVAAMATQMEIQAQQQVSEQSSSSSSSSSSNSSSSNQTDQTQGENSASTSTGAHQTYQSNGSQFNLGTPVLNPFTA